MECNLLLQEMAVQLFLHCPSSNHELVRQANVDFLKPHVHHTEMVLTQNRTLNKDGTHMHNNCYRC